VGKRADCLKVLEVGQIELAESEVRAKAFRMEACSKRPFLEEVLASPGDVVLLRVEEGV